MYKRWIGIYNILYYTTMNSLSLSLLEECCDKNVNNVSGLSLSNTKTIRIELVTIND